jgi:hypothetical protein
MEARNRLLKDWFARIDTAQLKLPRFQRFEAWGNNEIEALLENVLRGLPSGTALILEVGDVEPFVCRTVVGAPTTEEKVNELLLDGQQRLTALWRAFNDSYEKRTYFAYLEPDEDFDGQEVPGVFGLGRWEQSGSRYPRWADNPREVWQRGYTPLSLTRPGDVFGEISDWCLKAADEDYAKAESIKNRISSMRESVNAYNIPFLSLPPTTPKHVAIKVFIKMNTSAVQLSAFDIVVAQMEGVTGESLHALVGHLKSKAPWAEEYELASEWALTTASLLQDRPPTQASFLRLDLTQLTDSWDVIADGISFAVDFVEQERVFDAERLPVKAVLSVLAALGPSMPPALDALGEAKALLRRYLWRAFATRRYDHATATMALQDYRGLLKVLRGKADPTEVPILDAETYPLPTLEELMRASWPRARDTLARGILAVAIRAGARDIADDSPATRTHLKSREYHHLFPVSLFGGVDLKAEDLCDRALNCALLTWNTNRHISAKEPIQYLRERVERSSLGEGQIRERLGTHLIPYDELNVGGFAALPDSQQREAALREKYEVFLMRRAELVLEQMEQLCAVG